MNDFPQTTKDPTAIVEVDVAVVPPMHNFSPLKDDHSRPQTAEEISQVYDRTIVGTEPDVGLSKILTTQSRASPHSQRGGVRNDSAADEELENSGHAPKRPRREDEERVTDLPASKRVASNPAEALSAMDDSKSTPSADNPLRSEINSLKKSINSEKMDADSKSGMYSSPGSSIDHTPESLSAMADHEKLLGTDGPRSAETKSMEKKVNSEELDVDVNPDLPSTLGCSTEGNELKSPALQKTDTIKDNLTKSGQLCEVELQGSDHAGSPESEPRDKDPPDVEQSMILSAEYEPDSSPIQSPSDDSSTDLSSSEDDNQEGYELLSPAEQVRRLMQEDAGSDDDGRGDSGGAAVSVPLRTLNEKPDEVVLKPDTVVTQDMKISELGNVYTMTDKTVNIKAKLSGEYEVLEGSLLCLEDRSVIGVIADTWGPVREPFYTVRFNNAAEISDAGIFQGIKVFYVEQVSTRVFTQLLRVKGSDASNLHDEEVGDAEIEFSDDELEAEHKKKLKQMKLSTRGGRLATNEGFPRGAQSSRSLNQRPDYRPFHIDDALAIRYDDNDQDDELYTPLTRPSNLHAIMSQGGRDGPVEVPRSHYIASTGYHVSKPRGNRGRSRGDRGRGRGVHNRGSRGGSNDRPKKGYHQKNDPSDESDRRSGENRKHELSQYLESNALRSLPTPISDPGNTSYTRARNAGVAITPRNTQQTDPGEHPPLPPLPPTLRQFGWESFSQQSYPAQNPDLYGQTQQPQQYNIALTHGSYGQTHPPQQNSPAQDLSSYRQTYEPQRQNLPPQYPIQNYRQQTPTQSHYSSTIQLQGPAPYSLAPGSYVNPALFVPQNTQRPSFSLQQSLPPELQQQQIRQPQILHIHATSSVPSSGDAAESSAAFIAAQQRLDILHNLAQGSKPPSQERGG